MKIKDRINLIPRNNWDYGFDAVFSSITGAFKHSEQAPNTTKMYQQEPVWTNSGRTSLYAILKALDLPAGAKVGVPLFCCSVVFNAISQAGLTPCFIDSNLDDFNMSVEDLRKKRAELSAVVPVHMFGNPADIDAITATVDPQPVIEDCAQSIYSTYKGRQTGTLSTASFFSFRCGKYISAGEGSAIFCRDPQLKAKVEHIVNAFEDLSAPKMAIDAGMTFVKTTLYNRPWYGLLGYPVGMRLDKKLNLTAKDGFEAGKVALSYLALIDDRVGRYQDKINRQRENARLLLSELKLGNFCLPAEDAGRVRNWFQFPITFETTSQRDAMAEYLLNQGIDTAKYLDDIVEEARAHYGYQGDCPNAQLLSKTVLLIPIHYKLHDRDIKHIARSVNDGARAIGILGGR